MIRSIWLVLLIHFAFALGQPNPEPVGFKHFLARFMTYSSLTADFQQTITGTFGDERADGTLWLKRPHFMKWEYRSPEPQFFYFYEREYSIYQPLERQVFIQTLDQDDLDQSPLAFLLNENDRWPNGYDIEEVAGSNQRETFILSQKNDRTPFGRVILHVRTTDFVIEEMVLYEDNGMVHRYRFHNIRTDEPVSDKMFRFKPPRGVQVIR